MVALPVYRNPQESESPSGACGAGCGSSCGAGLEKLYPTTAVRYGAMNWIGEFRYRPGTVFKCGAKVVIRTERGIELGQQVSLTCNGCSKSVTREQIKTYVENSGPEFYRLNSGDILREATAPDLSEHEHLNADVRDDIDRCALLAAQMSLDLKVVMCEHLLGGERIVFYFRSEARIDFRSLVKELARHYQTRIEMRQVGARDEARLVADYEICGRECCCKNFLKKLRPITMRMAKLQKSTLDPSKVSGRCGRLRCCLRYEHEGYEALDAKLPRVGARVQTRYGAATVIDRQVLTQLLLVRTDGPQPSRDIAIPIEELTVQDGPREASERRPEQETPAPQSRFIVDEESDAVAPGPGSASQPAGPPRSDQRGDRPSRRSRRSRRRPRPDRPNGPPPAAAP
jgi:cell fate regulator YaaT (PSP1 superfamily)